MSRMRVLVAHNFYRSSAPSGENQLVNAEVGLLRDGGVDVVEMFADSDTIHGARGRPTRRARRGLLAGRRPPLHTPPGEMNDQTLSTCTRSIR